MLEKETVSPKVAGVFYQGIVASMLLYWSKMLVLSILELTILEGFHVEAARHLTGMKPKNEGGK